MKLFDRNKAVINSAVNSFMPTYNLVIQFVQELVSGLFDNLLSYLFGALKVGYEEKRRGKEEAQKKYLNDLDKTAVVVNVYNLKPDTNADKTRAIQQHLYRTTMKSLGL